MHTSEKILIVDDARANLEIISSILGDEYRIETAIDGEEGLKRAKTFRPGIVLLDIMMPGIDGYEVCRQMRLESELEGTKIILVSAKGTVDDRLKGYEAGADDYIQKPFDRDELLAKTRVFSRLNREEQKSRQLNRLLLMRQQDIPNVLWECDTDLRLTFIDDNIRPLLGYTPDEVLGMPVFDLLDKAAREFESSFKSKLNASSPSTRGVPYSFRTKDGGALTLQVFADAIYDSNEGLTGMGGIFRDMNDFVQLLESDSPEAPQMKIRIDPDLKLTFPDETAFEHYPFSPSDSGEARIDEFLDDTSVTSMLSFAFAQAEDIPFPVELSLPDEKGEKHPFSVELRFVQEGPCLEGTLIPSSARDQLHLVSKRIENQSQTIKNQEESLKNAVIMDDETRSHILKDAQNLSSEMLDLLKSLQNFSFPDEGRFSFEEYTQFIAFKNLQLYAENLRLLGNKLHGLKGNCGFLFPPAKDLCHRMEEITRPLADFEIILTHSLSNLLKQFIFRIEELLESLDELSQDDSNLSDWFMQIEQSLIEGREYIQSHATDVMQLIRERSVDHGEIRTRKKEEYISVSLDGYQELSEKIKELYYSFNSFLKSEQGVQAGSLFNDILSTHQEIKKIPLVLTRYERLVPKLAADYGKEADFQFIDRGVKADREFWDSIHEILNHMLKNAVIHGIEPVEQREVLGKPATGNVKVELKEDALHILLSVSDDGRGIDAELVRQKALDKGLVSADELKEMNEEDIFNLLFLQGVSTAQTLDDNAGRGVGMNAVKEAMYQLQGECRIESKPNEGSTWHFSFVKSNVSLACIIVAIDDFFLAIPEDFVETFVDYEEERRQTVKQAPAYRYNESLIPLLDSRSLFSADSFAEGLKNQSVVVLHYNEERKGLIINQIIHHAVQPILPLPKIYRNVPIYQGITIYNNDPIQVVNVEKLF